MSDSFRAMMITDVEGKPKAGFADITQADLPEHEVLVEIAYSTLNYKDGLALSGKGRIARRRPMVAGIDLAGTVVDSASPDWVPGDKVVVNGWGLSETEWGGYSRYQRLKPQWLTRLPEEFTAQQAMAIGTAGYTAALCVDALERWGAIRPGGGEVLVTGAAGGVGSTAISLLAAKGYTVTAATGRPETHDYLAGLGASGFVARADLAEAVTAHRPAPTRVITARGRDIGKVGPRNGTEGRARGKRNTGPGRSTAWGRPRWPMCWRRPAMAAPLRPAVWRGAWICQPRWRRISCAASLCWASTA